MEIYYQHKLRRITNDDDVEMSFDEAKAAYDIGEVTDTNLAFQRQLELGGDMDQYQADMEAIET